jgi:hypothetical protein
VDHLAECLWRIVADEDFKQKLSRQALATAKEDFTLKRMVDGMEAAIRYCVDSTRNRQETGIPSDTSNAH